MPYTSSDIAEIRKKREERQSTGSGTSGGKWQAADVARIRRESAAAREGGRARRPELDSDLYTRRTGRPAEGTEPRRTATSTRQAEEPGGLLGDLLGIMQRNTEINNSRAYRTEEIRQEADRELGQALANAITPDDPVKALGRAQRSTGLRTVPAERREEIVRESLREDGRTDEEIDAAKSRTPEALYNEYNQWLEEGDNRQRLNDLVQSEQAARKESDIDERMHRLGYTDAEIEEIRTRRREYEQSVPFGYDIGHRIASSAAGIGSQAVGSALMGLPVMAQGLEDFLLHDYDTRPEDIDGLAGSMYRLGRQIYDQGDESLGEARLGLSDMQDVAYSLGEMAGENVGMAAIFGPQALLIEQSLRALGGGVADMADEGRGAESAALSGLAHGAVSYGIERLGIAQMMRNMGRATGMGVVTDSILDRIASLPGIARLGQSAPWLAGTISSAGEEAAEEFVQTYADTAVDALLGRETPGLLSGELLGEAAQSAAMGAAGGGVLGALSSGIGAAQDVRQGRIAPRADLMANAQLSAAVEQAGQVGQAAQAAAAQTQQAEATVSETETVAQPVGQAAPAQRAVDPRLAELAAQSGGRLDASAWQAMQAQRSAAPGGAANAESTAAPQMSWEERAAAQGWSEEQYAEARLLAAGTDMSEAAVNVAAQAMPDGVSGDIYSMAANSMYQLARQGIAEDADEALALAGRSGVRVNQVLAAPGGAEALRMIYNRGKMDGLAASGYGAAGLADEAKAGQAQYEAGALIPEEDRALFDLYAAASDTAVTVSEKLEKNAGGYVDTALGKVYFGAGADADTFGTILHESVHQYNAWDEAGGRELQTATLRYMAEQSGFESVIELVESYIQRYQEAGQELSYAQACEEITADAMRGVFGSEEAFGRWVERQRALAEQNGKQRSAVARVMDKVRGMLDKVIEKAKSILSREPDNAAAKQAQALAENQKRVLEDLYYKHAEAAAAAQRAAREGGTESETFNNQSVESEESVAGDAENAESVAESAEFGSAAERMEDARRYQLPVDERAMESGQRAADWEGADLAGMADSLAEVYEDTEVHAIPDGRLKQMARKMVKDAGSKADWQTVHRQLRGLADYLGSGKANYEWAVQAAEGIAEPIMQKSTRRDDTLWKKHEDLHYFTVHVDKGSMEQRELIVKYGSYKQAQKELAKFGIKVTTGKDSNARGIDQLYQELSNEYPGWFPPDVTGPMERLEQIAQMRQSIKVQYVNDFDGNWGEARADMAMQILGGLAYEGITDKGLAKVLQQRFAQSMNDHRATVQQRMLRALERRDAEVRTKAVSEATRKAWAGMSTAMRKTIANSDRAVQRAREARRADQLRRQIVLERTKLNRMLLHPSDQYHVPQKFMQAALQVTELANYYTYNKKAVEKLQALRSQLEDLAKAAEEGDSFAADWENSGIPQMLASLSTSMDRASSARLEGQAKAQAGRIESGQKRLNELRNSYENMDLGDRVSFTPDELAILRDTMRAMVTVIQNSNKLLATRTAQSASEFASVATQEVATSKFRLKGRSNPFAKFQNKWNANFKNAERMLMHMGGYRHGGAMEALSKTLSEGEAKQTEIREKGLQGFANVLKGKENEKKLRKFSGVDAELIDVGLVLENGEAVKVNRAQAAGLYMHLLNPQNREHVTRGGIVVPDMKAYAKGNMDDAYRLRQTAHMKDAGETLQTLERMLEQDGYFRQWVEDTKEFFNVYTKNVINKTSRRLAGYDKATVDNYYPLAVDRSVLQQEIQGVIYNGTIEGRGFLKPRQEHAAQPVLLEEIDRVMVRSLADTAAYGGLAMAVRDANKILNANHQEGNSLYGAIENAFDKEGVKFVKDYLSDLQRQRQAEKSIYDFLGGLRGNYAGAVLTLNLSTVLGQYSGVPAAAAELGTDATWDAFKFMAKPQKAETLEAIRKEMTDHGYWQLESTLSTGATAELAELRKKRGVISWVAEHTPGVNALEHMDMKTRVALWEGSKHYVDQHLEEFNLPADAHGSDAWWDAVRGKMTQANDRTQPNYTVSQQAAIQRSTDQLVKTLVMFKSQSFQNLGIVTSAVEDYRAQSEYVKAAAKKLENANLDGEQRQQAQAELERARGEQKTAAVRLKRAVASQAASSALYVVATLFVKDLLLHRYDRDKDENGKITPASVARRVGWETAMNLMENIPFVDIGMGLLQGDSDPISLSGIDSIADAADDARKLVSDLLNEDRTSKDAQARQDYWNRLAEQAFDTLESGLNLAGVPFGQFNRWRESVMGWIGDISTAANSDGLNLWDVMNAPPSSASQYDRLYTDVFEEPDAEDAAKALERLADLDALNPPAKASNAKAADGKVLGELLSREREYGTRVESAAAARVAGNEGEQRRLRQELVNTLAEALGISQTDKADARRLRTVIDKVDAAITAEVKEQMGADSATGATVYTPLLTAIEDGGDVKNIQASLRRAGVDDGAIKSAVVSAYKDDYLYGSEAERQKIEGQLLRLSDVYGEPYFTKTKDQDDFADWVTDWELQGLNESVYTDLDEALATGNQAAAQEQINRYMEAGKSASSIRTQITNQYKKEYLAADSARRQEIAQFIMRLHGTKGERFITADTLYSWVLEDAKAKAMAGR